MGHTFKEIPLHRLNIPTETLRRSSTNAGDETLKKSLQKFGVLSPLVVTELGSRGDNTEYAVWDGTRRTRLLRDLNTPTTVKLPCMVVEGDDRESLVRQVNINNARERLSEFAEAEALRQLVSDHGMKQVEAAEQLMKSKSWASAVMKVWGLPLDILSKVRKGEVALTHAMIISDYQDFPEIQKVLLEYSLSGEVSTAKLKAIGLRAKNDGLSKARKLKPQNHDFGKKSSLRVEPMQQSLRFEVRLNDEDSIDEAIETLKKIAGKVRA